MHPVRSLGIPRTGYKSFWRTPAPPLFVFYTILLTEKVNDEV